MAFKPRVRSSGIKTASPLRFDGFPEAGFRFLQQLKKHNERDWFREHKADYEEQVEQPMMRLVSAVAAECRAAGVHLFTKEREPVFRVHRDIRFSKDKSPYKTHVAAELRRFFSDSEVLLYIHLQPDNSFLGAGVWQMERPLLHAWRESIVQDPSRFEAVVSALAKQDLAFRKDKALSTMPRGFKQYSDQGFAPWLKMTSFVVTRQLAQADCANPALVQRVVNFAIAARPLLEFAWGLEAAKPKPIPL